MWRRLHIVLYRKISHGGHRVAALIHELVNILKCVRIKRKLSGEMITDLLGRVDVGFDS